MKKAMVMSPFGAAALMSAATPAVYRLDRSAGPLLKRVPGHVGKTFAHISPVGYEWDVKAGGIRGPVANKLSAKPIGGVTRCLSAC